MNLATVTANLDTLFHPEYQEHYDNSGFLLGNPSCEISGAIVALDVTEQVVDEAINKKANLIVTHHPFIFSGLKRITPFSLAGRLTLKLIENNIAVYAAHTNLDNLSSGVNAMLAEQLELKDCTILRPLEGKTDVGAGMVGMLDEAVDTGVFLQQVKSKLGLPATKVNSSALKKHPSVQRVAICGGSGSFLIDDAVNAGADIFLTGDLKYHDYQQADEALLLADIGHYESECFSRLLLAKTLEKMSQGLFPVQIATTTDRWEEWL